MKTLPANSLIASALRRVLCASIIVAGTSGLAGADLVLFDFEGSFDPASASAQDAKAAAIKSGNGTVLAVSTGHEKTVAGVALAAPAVDGISRPTKPSRST